MRVARCVLNFRFPISDFRLGRFWILDSGFWIQQIRPLRVPQRKPFSPNAVPGGLQPDDAGGRVARAQNCAGQNVARIMHAVINARKGNGQRHWQHEPPAFWIKKKRDHRGGKPVGRVRRRHGAGGGAAEPRDDIRQRHAWSRPGDGMFDDVDDERVAQQGDERHRQRAQTDAGTAKKGRDKAGEDGEDKPLHHAVAAQDGHEPVKERIAQRPVDEMEQARVECLQPVHRR